MTTEGAPDEVAAQPVEPAPAEVATPAPGETASPPPVEPTPVAIIHPTPPAPLVPSSTRTLIRAVLTLVLFVASIGLGAAVHVGSRPPEHPVDRFPTIAGGAAEPAVSAEIARAIMAKDPQQLAKTYTAELLQGYQGAMSPIIEADDIHFVGAVERGGETLASYVVSGQTSDGSSMISGLVVHVKDNKISGFN